MTAEPATRKPRKWLALLPLAIFLMFAAVFLAELMSGRDVSAVPSVLIGSPAPVTTLSPLGGSGLPGLDSNDFQGKVTLVNVWASWCTPCRQEHPVLMGLKSDTRFSVSGLNYKDKSDNARRFLADLGNPFSAIGIDPDGRTAIDWGVYGVPETFVVGRDGKILFKHVGPLDADSVRNELMPEIEKALSSRS